MSEELVIVNKQDLEVIANAARNQTGTQDPYSISELAQAMANTFIPTVNKKQQMLYTDNNSEPKWSDLPFVTPQMFGAKGDNATDDTEAFQRAIDFLNTYNDYGNKGGLLVVPNGRYIVRELYFDNTTSITLMGTGRANNCCVLKYVGTSYCLNIHGNTHLKIENICIVNNNDTPEENSGGIRLYDRYENIPIENNPTDSRNNDIIFNGLKIIGFQRGVALDSPCGYVSINETLIEQIRPDGLAISIGEFYNMSHYNSGRYIVPPSYIYINKVFCGGDEWVDATKGNPIRNLIGIYYGSCIYISNCDFCNMSSGHAIYCNDEKGDCMDIYLYDNDFFNIKEAILFEMSSNNANRTMTNIHSRSNRYFIGSWEQSTPITIKGNSSRTIYGFSSVGDTFRANEPKYYKELYKIEYARNIQIDGYSVTPNADFFDLWSSSLYSFNNVTNIIGAKTLTLYIKDAITSSSGMITVPIKYNIWKYPPSVLCNISDLLSSYYNVTVSSISDNSVTLRFRRLGDGSAVTDTSITSRITLTGL